MMVVALPYTCGRTGVPDGVRVSTDSARGRETTLASAPIQHVNW